MQNVNTVDALLRSCLKQLDVRIGRLDETKVRKRLPLVRRRTKDSWSSSQDPAEVKSETID
jgi:hypothetical protein